VETLIRELQDFEACSFSDPIAKLQVATTSEFFGVLGDVDHAPSKLY
jgi:hypothetical protein